MRVRKGFVCLGLLLVAMPVFGAESVESAVPWYGHVQLWELVFAAITFGYGLLKVRYNLQASKAARVLQFMEAGVQYSFDEFVKDAKSRNESGKLSKDEIRKARDIAWEKAQEFAEEKGMVLAKEVSAEYLPVLIAGVVKKMKSK